MKKILNSLLFIFFLGSCYHTTHDPSFDMALVLQPDSMVSLLTDLHTADGIIGANKDKKIPAGHLATEYFEAIMQKHRINKAIFDESMRYYAFHNEELNGIYEKVIIDLSKQESMAIPAKEADSSSSKSLP
jgi:hypothetical protein